MTKREILKSRLKKCGGFDIQICRNCRRQLDGEDRLVMGIGHGKCQFYVK